MMTLNIYLDKRYSDIEKFIHDWLLPAMRKYLRSSIISSKKQLERIYPNNFNICKDLFDATDNLTVNHFVSTGQIFITIDSFKFNLKKTAKLYDICAMVNYGSISYPANPIFTKTFKYFKDNFWRFYKYYTLGILKCL